MKLLLTILLFFTVAADAQITSSVYSGARFGGVVDTGGGTFITLSGCSTQTEILGVDYLKNDYPVFDWRNTDFYTDDTDNPIFGSTQCLGYRFSTAWMKNSAKYVSVFYDLDDDGDFEYLADNSFLITTDSIFGYNYWDYYIGQLLTLDELKTRVIFHDVPVYNSCPTSVNGLVYDGASILHQDCKLPICQDTINIKPCLGFGEPYICIADDTYVIPIEGDIGGINITQLYEVMNGTNIELTEEDGSYFIISDYSSWIGWDIQMYFGVLVAGFSEEDGDIIGAGQIDPYTRELYIEFFDIGSYNDEWRIIIYSQNESLDVCYPDGYGIQYPFTYLIIENPNIIIL